MFPVKKGLILPVLLAALVLVLPVRGHAEDISGAQALKAGAETADTDMLFDMDLETAQLLPANTRFTFADDSGIAALYLILDREYGYVTLTDDSGGEVLLDTGGILHFYIDLEDCFGCLPTRVSLCFSDGDAYLNELRLFSQGELPGWVQRWERIPDGGADLVLFSTHGDDEQLFFAGLLPLYGAEKGYRIQVVYFTDHRNLTLHRVHEMLNGLWAVGIRNYPVFGPFPDYYTFDMADAYRYYGEQGLPEETLLSFVLEQLRRFRPLVAVGHDVDGEYGHGMHKLYTDLLCKAAELSRDPDAFPALAEQYGVWDVPKTYLHLYPENRVTLDLDTPLDAFEGKTAYETARDLGFACHVSQQKDFAWYFQDSDTASGIAKYNPCRYGLYRTTVGEDTEKNDLFENLGPRIPEPPLPEPPEPAEPETSPTIPAPPPAAAPGDTRAEKTWILFPAVGTLTLTVLTSCLSVPARKEK